MNPFLRSRFAIGALAGFAVFSPAVKASTGGFSITTQPTIWDINYTPTTWRTENAAVSVSAPSPFYGAPYGYYADGSSASLFPSSSGLDPFVISWQDSNGINPNSSTPGYPNHPLYASNAYPGYPTGYYGISGTFHVEEYLYTNFFNGMGGYQTFKLNLATIQFHGGILTSWYLGSGINGSNNHSGSQAADLVARNGRSGNLTGGDPVEVATGAESFAVPLFRLSGARLWEFSLAYNSVLASGVGIQGSFGLGWTQPYEASVSASGSNYAVHWDATHYNTFVPKTGVPNNFICSDETVQYDTLVYAGGGWTLKRPDQSSLVFDTHGRLIDDIDPHGRKLVISYSGTTSQITTIVEAVSGVSLTFTYNTAGQVATIKDSTGAIVSFTYSEGPPAYTLTKIVDQNSHQRTFTYDKNANLLTETDNAGNVLITNTYDSSGRVISQKDGVSTHAALAFAINEQGLAGNTLYAPSDTLQATPLPLTYTPTAPTTVSQPVNLITSVTGTSGVTINYNYDTNGKLISAVSPSGTTSIAYDANGNPTTITDPSGVTTPVTPSLTATMTDRLGAVSTYAFDPGYHLLTFTNGLGQSTTYTYDSSGNVLSTTDALGRTTHSTYDGMGNVLTSTDPAGNVTTYTYDGNNNLLTVADPAGNVTTRTYDTLNDILSLTDAAGHTTSWTYDTNGCRLSETLPAGGHYAYVYTTGRLTQSTDPNGVVVKFGYDADGRLAYRQDALGNRTSSTYDPKGNLLTVTNPLGQIAHLAYDYRDRPSTATDPLGAVTTYAYDNDSNLVSVTDPLGNITGLAYDGNNRLLTTTDPLGHAAARAYDAFGELSSTTDPSGNVTSYQYDAGNRLTTVIDPLGNRTVVTLDPRNLPLSVTDALSRVSSFTYDNLGRTTAKTNPLSQTTALAYDTLSRLTGATDPGGLATAEAFDANGNLASLMDASSHSTAFTHDAGNRLTAITTPAGRTTGFTYESRGLPQTTTKPSGNVTTVTYDAAYRAASVVDGVGTISITRDSDGRLLTETENGKTLTRTYDPLGRLTQYTDGGSNTLGYAYDNAGNLITLTYPDGKTVTYVYDSANRLTSVTDWASRTTSYVYDADGRLTKTTRPNGTVQNRAYDTAGQLTSLTELEPGGATAIYSGSYGYDLVGRVTSEAQLPSANAIIGSPITQTVDSDNRIVTFNGQPATYDADGDLQSLPGLITASYAYDARNRLTTAGSLSYGYDSEGHRVALTDSTGTTQFVVDPRAALSQLLVRTTASGTVTRYVYGLGLLYEDDGGAATYYHFSRRGDTVALTNQAGTILSQIDYGPFGEILSQTGSATTPFLFNGAFGVMTDSNGLCFNRARYYNPQIRRFLNQDILIGAIDPATALNRFGYANGDPINLVDPTGRWAVWDDVAAMASGAGISVAMQFVHNELTGESGGYWTAAMDGAIAGEVALYTGNPWAAGAAVGFATSLAHQLGNLDCAGGSISFPRLVWDTGVGALVGGLASQVPGLSTAPEGPPLPGSPDFIGPMPAAETELAPLQRQVLQQQMMGAARTAATEVLPEARDFLAGNIPLSEVPSDIATKAAAYFEEVAAPAAKSEADTAYQLARAQALRGQGPSPGSIISWRANFGK